jgi:HSP20 family molecular chaperone IbpA
MYTFSPLAREFARKLTSDVTKSDNLYSVQSEDTVNVFVFAPGTDKQNVDVTIVSESDTLVKLKVVAKNVSLDEKSIQESGIPSSYEYSVIVAKKFEGKSINLDSTHVKVSNGIINIEIPFDVERVRKFKIS